MIKEAIGTPLSKLDLFGQTLEVGDLVWAISVSSGSMYKRLAVVTKETDKKVTIFEGWRTHWKTKEPYADLTSKNATRLIKLSPDHMVSNGEDTKLTNEFEEYNNE